MESKNIIHFCREEYELFSNFSAHQVLYKGVLYQTAEHAYQVAKFVDPVMREKIKNAPSAYLAREYGQSEEGRTPDFDKVLVMKEIMREKCKQHADVRDLLQKTKDALIEKNHPQDYFWGTGADGSGENVMGKIWMELRKEFL